MESFSKLCGSNEGRDKLK